MQWTTSNASAVTPTPCLLSTVGNYVYNWHMECLAGTETVRWNTTEPKSKPWYLQYSGISGALIHSQERREAFLNHIHIPRS
jgi:hypothetical protein